MFTLLVKSRIQGLLNVAKHSAHNNRWIAVGLSLAGVVLFVGIFFAFVALLNLTASQASLVRFVYEIYYFLFLFLLAGAVPFVASTLLHSQDYLLLGAAPIRPATIVAAKLLDAIVTNSLQFLAIGIPALVACGFALKLSPVGWLLLLVDTVLFLMLPALLTAFALLCALALVGTRRIRGAIGIVNTVMALAVCLTIVKQGENIQLVSHDPNQLLGQVMVRKSSVAEGNPSGWFADVVVLAANQNLGEATSKLLFLSLGVGLLYGVCTWMGGRMLSAATLSEEQERHEPGISTAEISDHRAGLLGLLSPPVAALIAKDLRYILRDSVLLSQLGMPVLLFIVPFALASQESFRTISSPTELYPFAAGMIGFILFMQTSILSLSSIGLENRGFWLYLTSPNSGRALLWAKFLMSAAVSTLIGCTLTLIAGLSFRAALWMIGLQCAGIAVVSCALCGLGVGISASLPRFIYENPAHRVSVWGLILGFVTTTGYMIFSMLIVGLGVYLGAQEPASRLLIYGVSVALFLVLTAVCTFVPLALGARRIELYQWDH